MTDNPTPNAPVKLGHASKGLMHHHSRLDIRRDTRAFVTRNVSGHLHITLGNNEATVIIHPHAAVRLIADMQAVLQGSDYAAD